jgi:hypothetical protein
MYSSTGTRSSSQQNEYAVGLSISGSADFVGLFKTTVKEENKWTWTNTDTRSTSAGTSESASVTVGGPAYGYSGPTDIAVYYDVIYKSFLFVPIEAALPTLRGLVTSFSKKAVNGKEVVLVANGVKYRTFTNAKGEYRIFGKISGPLQLKVDSVTKKLPQLQLPGEVNVALP